jgi:hypothetical protein
MIQPDRKKIKDKINADWQEGLPLLSLYALNRLYRIVGPIIIGIDLIKLPRTEEYRPHFVCYPLWKHSIEECLKSPFILIEFKNKKGLQIDIPFEKHALYFNEALESVKTQMPFLG